MDDGMNRTPNTKETPTYGGSRFRMEFEAREQRKERSGRLEKALVTLGFALAVLLITMVLVVAGTSI